MPISNEVRRLQAKWLTNTGWPKRLVSMTIRGLRGWTGQQFDFGFPIMAIVGENGVGKSTVLQCAASVYRSPSGPAKSWYASDYLPDTAWEKITNAEIAYRVKEGDNRYDGSIRKPGERWRGNPERRERVVEYIDLKRVQPILGRVGYSKLAKPQHRETESNPFDKYRLERLSQIMGHRYDSAKMALTDADNKRYVAVLSQQNAAYSGFHQGAGETTIAELLKADWPKYGLVLIDEIETSLHPRSQRRLIRDLADRCRDSETQLVLTTHSPYILDELPLEARAYIIQTDIGRQIVYGVSPEFAMTKMDDQPHYECDLYVEDERAGRLLVEILTRHAPSLVQRCQIIPYGAASVGQALGIMASQKRFPRPSCVFLDGDRGPAPGCIALPGDDAPERVVFDELAKSNWGTANQRTGRNFADFADACAKAMLLKEHHDWVQHAATTLVLGGEILWQAMCAEWAERFPAEEAAKLIKPIESALIGSPLPLSATIQERVIAAPAASKRSVPASSASNEKPQLSQQSLFAPKP
jgi:predicted ATPase